MGVGARREVIGRFRRDLETTISGGAGRVFVVSAEPGAGKTHTLRTCTADLGVPVRWAMGDELSWRHPYGVAAVLLDVVLPDPVPADADRLFLDRLDAICAAGPVVLVVDDAHHADAATLSLLGLIAGAARNLPVVLVVARRRLPAREQITRLLARAGVTEVDLPTLDAMDLDVLVHERAGAWPDPALRDLLTSSAAGNPMHALGLLDELERAGALHRSGESVALDPAASVATVPATLEDVVAGQLALLDAPARDLVQKLAVWGSAASLDEIAGIDGSAAAALVGPVQTATQAGVVDLGDDGKVAFRHDLYAEVAYASIPVALRSVLHTACARRPAPVSAVAHHLLAAGAATPELVDVVRAANQSLQNAPAVAADLLGEAEPLAAADPAASARLGYERARALARSGQFARAIAVARAALGSATDPGLYADLQRALMFSLVAQGRVDEVLVMIDTMLGHPVPDETRAMLDDYRSYLALLGGVEPVPLQPFSSDPQQRSLVGLVGEALRRYMVGETAVALEYAVHASGRYAGDDLDPNDGSSADIWPVFVESANEGPIAAVEHLRESERLRAQRGNTWLTPYQQFSAAGIDFVSGRLDDAAAQFDSALEVIESAEMAWTSLAIGPRAEIDVYRGNLTEAEARLDAFARSGAPNQFGLPEPERARVGLLEAQRRHREAAELTRVIWTRAVTHHCYTWLARNAGEFAHVALRAADAALLQQICTDLELVPRPLSPACAGSVTLALALDAADPADMLAGALDAAGLARAVGEHTLEMLCLEEAACAAAVAGAKDEARAHARATLALAESAGAATVTARVHSRLRSAGVRLGATGARRRPQTGWASLTPTEARIAELVASGMTGPEVASQLYISPRTVQTHVSHALAKLGLRTRVELAAAAVGASRV